MGFALLLATAAGLSVANIYYAQPLLDQIGAALHVSAGNLGLTTAITQLGYLLGLILLVPLGDLVDPRRLISWMTLTAGAGLTAAGLAGGPAAFFAACAVVGVASTVVQVITAYAAAQSAPDQRGRVIGVVTSGVVLGILLARTVSGAVAESFGWRAAFLLPAVLMAATAAALNRLLPRRPAKRAAVPYLRLISSVFMLTRHDRVFRTRSLLALFQFGCFGVLWGSVALPLSAAPWHLSTSQIGLFGIVGAAGALSANGAGRLADRGRASTVTTVMLVLLVLSWAAIRTAPFSLVLLTVGIVVLDFAGQALHVTNQHLIVAGNPEATSRVIGGYMVYYSIGVGGGAIAATSLYSAYGWGAVCSFGAALAVLALVVGSLGKTSQTRTHARS
ncbi:putative MFS family arabinose efflux permease [Catenulispora sp. EB89]|uniref:MFS transporter n=1 Tax=Catenulispora sp. EB89 TaxID=3156257 RepID=UPI0035138269